MQFRQLIEFSRPYRGRLLTLTALSLASSLVLLPIPWLAGQIVGGIASASAVDPAVLVGLIIVSLVAVSVLNFVRAAQATATAARVHADLRCTIFEHVQRLPLAFHDRQRKGDTLALLTTEVERLSNFVTNTLVSLPARLLLTVGSIALMFRIDARLALIVPLLIPAFYLILKIVGRRQRALSVALQEDEATAMSVAEEMLEMLPATKAFGRERTLFDRYRAAVETVRTKRVLIDRIHAALEPLIALVASLGAVVILLAARQTLQAGEMSPSELFSFIFYAALLTRPVGALADVYGQVQMARGALARLQSVNSQPAEALPHATAGKRAPGDIRFENVCFAYPDRPPLLKGVNFHIKARETVALTGANGAGKTAIINLLMRFYEPQSGTISIDGRDMTTVELTEFRRNIGLVPQTTFLLNGTIRDNIGFGAENPSQEAIDEAARLAQAYDFVMALPERMDTVIGDRGLRLSGGQRQRIALARALIKDPAILVLDEATSMFDEEGEAAFIETCSEALRGRTVLLITHRPATLALADRIFLLQDGAMTETDQPRTPLSVVQA